MTESAAQNARHLARIKSSTWACGTAAAAALRSMVEGKQVNCVPLDADIYGRTVAQCRAGRKDLGAELMRSGLAVVYDCGIDLYGSIEATSKASRMGILGSKFEMLAAY
jgi:endonuclease YncB( thermonuclease family)